VGVKSTGGPLQKILDAKQAQNGATKITKPASAKASSSTKPPPVRKDPYLEQEEMELARLSKLLGIDKSKQPFRIHVSVVINSTNCSLLFACRSAAKEGCRQTEQGV
jgi:hypothetical protein